MKRFVQWIAKRRFPDESKPYSERARAKLGALEGWVSIASNTVLALAKVGLALLSGSLSLMADAVHTFADSLTSLVVIVGFRMAGKPADDEHPFGHARIESIATLIIGVLLAVAAVELGHAAVDRLLAPAPVQAPTWMIVAVIAMALAKELMARFSFELGVLIGSDALEADAWHHRSDVFATLLVAAAFIASRFDINWFDGAAGIGVALIVAAAAYRIIAQAAQPLIGERLNTEEIAEISRIASSVDGVRGVHDIVVQRYGTFQVISLHAVVSRELNVVEAHDISQAVETALQQKLFAHATVHIDPAGEDHPETGRVKTALTQAVATLDGLKSVHDLRIRNGRDGAVDVSFDVQTERALDESISIEYRTVLTARVSEILPHARVSANFDPPFCLAISE